jgi:DNA-binding GntR family transcriptional regulator
MSRSPKIVRPALADKVHALLLERILDQHYMPGARLNIDALSRELALSASPVREALTRLAGEGLVTLSSFSGFSVTPMPTREWFEQLLEYRVIVEGWAARRAARLRPAAAIDAMAKSLDILRAGSHGLRPRDYPGANRADEAFHGAMLSAAGNDVLHKTVQELRPHLHYARLLGRGQQDVDLVIYEHLNILDAIKKGDEDAACVAVETHLRTSWRRYEANLAEGMATRRPDFTKSKILL